MELMRQRFNDGHEERAMAYPRERRWSTILCVSGVSLSAVDIASGSSDVVIGSKAVAAFATCSVSSMPS